MEYPQAPPARAVSCTTTDILAAPAKQVDEGDSVRRLPSIQQLSLAFMEKTKLRFGEHSHDLEKIHDIAGKFTRGEVSKKETISIISDIIRTHGDLRHDLLAILNHDDARWGPGDFDLPQEPVPQFLQPAHQPQMRLLSLSVPWESNTRAYTPFTPVMYGDNGGRVSLDDKGGNDTVDINCGVNRQPHALSPTPTPFNPLPPHELVTNKPGIPDFACLTNLMSVPNFDHGSVADHANVDSARKWQPQQSQYLDTWSKVDYGNVWATDGHHTLDEHERSTEISQSPRPHSAMRCPIGFHTKQSPDAALPPLRQQAQADSQMLPSLQLSTDLSLRTFSAAMSTEMPPPPPLPDRGMPGPDGKLEEKPEISKESHGFGNARGDKSAAKYRKKSNKSESTTDQSRSEGNGAFVHGLCGKRFATRSKVKKHHWGNKNDDLDTKTGCWAKHNKPNASWDDHPSCRLELKPRVVRESPALPKPRHNENRPESTEYKAPVVPGMVPTYRTTPPEFSIQQNQGREQLEMSASSRPSGQYAEAGYLPYHTHRLPARSSFESLLSAVNIASQIETPVPQGRNDWPARHSDAQAAAAERESQCLPAWAFPAVISEDDFGYGDPLPAALSGYTPDRVIPDHVQDSSRGFPFPSHTSTCSYSSVAASPIMPVDHTRDDVSSTNAMNGMASDDPGLYPWEHRSSMQWSR